MNFSSFLPSFFPLFSVTLNSHDFLIIMSNPLGAPAVRLAYLYQYFVEQMFCLDQLKL